MRRLVVLLLVLATPAPAQAWTTTAIPPALTGPDVAAGGGRWAIASYGDASFAIFDDRNPGWRVVTPPVRCALEHAVAGDRAVVTCPGPGYTRVLTLMDLRTGALSPVPFVDPYPGTGDYHPVRLGARWIETTYSGYHFFQFRYVRITDGALRSVDRPRRTADLDARDVSRPLCAPLRRPPVPQAVDHDPPFEALLPDGRRFVLRRHPAAYDYATADVYDWRCGDARPRRLYRCTAARQCQTPQAGGGVVTARRGDGVVVARLRSRRVTEVALDGATTVAHTRHHLVAAGTGTLRFRGL